MPASARTAECEICAGAVEPAVDKLAPAPYEVSVAAASTGLRSELQAGEYALTLDAGKGLGGEERGPSPVQAFISSIVACSQVGLLIIWQNHACLVVLLASRP
jgi:hypothetical protein